MENTHTWAKGHNQVGFSDSNHVYVDGGQCCVPRKEKYFPYFWDLQFITHMGQCEVLTWPDFCSPTVRTNFFWPLFFQCNNPMPSLLPRLLFPSCSNTIQYLQFCTTVGLHLWEGKCNSPSCNPPPPNQINK